MSMADAFDILKQKRKAATSMPTDKSGRTMAKVSPPPLPLQGVGKRNHPDYEPVKVYLRKSTHMAARQKLLQDASKEDLSTLVEALLRKHLGL